MVFPPRPGRSQKEPRLISVTAGVSGEHWAEKLDAELGKLLGVPVARVELAESERQRGSLSPNLLNNIKQAWGGAVPQSVQQAAGLFV